MFTVSVEMSFRASHQLTLADGSREAAHEHNWSVRADVSSEKLGGTGVVMDFHGLKRLLGEVVGELEGSTLESVGPLRENNASAENVAKYIYEGLQGKLAKGAVLESITVGEEPGCWAKYCKRRKGVVVDVEI